MNDEIAYSPRLSIRVVWVDLPDMLEIEARLTAGDWSGVTRAYASPTSLAEEANMLATWAERPTGDAKIEVGADTGIGWLRLRFYPIDMAKHMVCHVQMATSGPADCRPERVQRLALEIATEPVLIIAFAKELASLARTQQCDAVLDGVP